MHSRCEQQICPVYNDAEMHGEKMENRSGRVIKDNPEVFLSDKRTTDAIAHGNGESCSPRLKLRYLIPIPYDLCILTKYQR